MATEDISRNATGPRKRYTGIRLQQGRVSTDDDYNEGARLDAEQTRQTLLDVIGPAGSADGGFAISNPRRTGSGELDFDIGAGTLYLGGERLVCFGETFAQQPDWLEQAPTDRAAPADGRVDQVYLMAWEQPAEAVEDTELFETALGGPDTATRVRLMHRVLVAAGVQGGDCGATWAAVAAQLAPTYGAFNSASSECRPDSTLQVTFDTSGATEDLCTPSVIGGYLGAENQAVRVQIVDATHFTWGFDNAAPLYRVTVGADRTTITLQTEPKDQAHWMQSGQVVEILPWSAVLPNGEKLAEISGHLTSVAAAYDPDLHTLTLQVPLPGTPAPGFGRQWEARADAAALGAPATYYYLRVWPRGSDTTSAATLPFVPSTPVTLGNSGVRVTLRGSVFVPGDHWVIAARPEDPQRVVPWDLLQGRAPHGIRRLFTPLARIVWSVNDGNTSGSTVEDCRTPFQPLTRRQTCCTYTVGDGVHSHGNFTIIQDAIDRLPPDGGCICILPGRYDQDVRIDGRRQVRIEGCGARTLIRGAGGSTTLAVVSIIDSTEITVTDLAISSPDRIAVQLVSRRDVRLLRPPIALARVDAPGMFLRGGRLSRVRLHALAIEARGRAAVVMAGGRMIEFCDSTITLSPLATEPTAGSTIGRWPAVFVAADDVLVERTTIEARANRVELGGDLADAPALSVRARLALGGIQIAGGSDRVTILRNRITGGAGNGITLGSIAYVPRQALDAFDESPQYERLSRGWRPVAGGGGLVIDDNGCLIYVLDPTPPNGPNEVPLVPISTGALTDIRIEDNQITGMGQSGIAPALFFDPQVNAQAIVLTDLLIARNRIEFCLQVELPEITGGLAGWAAYGAIALPAVSGVRVEGNTVAGNGRSHLQPICGLFVLAGTGIDVLGNTIRDNGPRIASEASGAPGLRGGIFIGLAFAPTETIGTEARPAVRIHDNIVVCQAGQALAIAAALGTVSVVRNALTSRGLSALAGATDPLGNIAAVGGAGAAAEGTLASPFLALGACVAIVDLGVSSELVQPGSFTNARYATLERSTAITPRGALLFTDNQVLLQASSANERLFVTSSVMLLSLDDVGAHNNQFAAWIDSFMMTDLLVAAGGLRITGNRLSETATRCMLSAIGFGGMATAALNQSTHCLYIVSLFGNLGTLNSGNLVAIDILSQSQDGPALCSQDYGSVGWRPRRPGMIAVPQ